MTNKINIADVLSVAKRLNIETNNKMLDFVMNTYDEYLKLDPNSTWDLVVEEVLYSAQSLLNKKFVFTEEMLINSKEFKEWVTGKVELIHNTYWDAKEPYQAYIVLHSDALGVTITRFFVTDGKIQVSVDDVALTPKEVYKALLHNYSRGLL